MPESSTVLRGLFSVSASSSYCITRSPAGIAPYQSIYWLESSSRESSCISFMQRGIRSSFFFLSTKRVTHEKLLRPAQVMSRFSSFTLRYSARRFLVCSVTPLTPSVRTPQKRCAHSHARASWMPPKPLSQMISGASGHSSLICVARSVMKSSTRIVCMAPPMPPRRRTCLPRPTSSSALRFCFHASSSRKSAQKMTASAENVALLSCVV